MAKPFLDGMVRYDFPDAFGIAVEYDPDEIDFLKGKHLDDEDVQKALASMTACGRDALVSMDSLGLDFCLDWSTGINFKHDYEHEGGGYIYSLTHDCIYGPTVCVLLVEWHDDFVEDEGLEEERLDELTSFYTGVPFLNDFLAGL